MTGIYKEQLDQVLEEAKSVSKSAYLCCKDHTGHSVYVRYNDDKVTLECSVCNNVVCELEIASYKLMRLVTF